MPNLTQAMNAAKIETTITKTDAPVRSGDSDRDKWDRSAYHYRVTFLIRGNCVPNDRSMVVPFSTGNGWERYPSAAEVMRCVLSDTMDVHPNYGEYRFEPWAENYGYDTDSRKAEDLFKRVTEQAAEFETFLTLHTLNAWLADTELLESESTDAPTGRAIKRIKPQDRKF